MTATLQDAIAALHRLGCKPTSSKDGYTAYCPIHEADGKNHKQSLTVAKGDKQGVVIHCHAGCGGAEILKVLGIESAPRQAKEASAVYSYRDESGREVRQKVRFEPKDFRIRHKDATGEWVYKAGDGPPVLYRFPELKVAIAEGRTVFLVEGEKDADRLAKLGLVATTNIEGAAQPNQKAKWKTEYTDQLASAARVVLLPDNDEPGRAHMAHVAKELTGKVKDIRVLELPSLPPKGDVSDWLNAGGTVEKLKELVNTANLATSPSIAPAIQPFTEEELSEAQLAPRCIVDKYLYADLGLKAAPGGTGKTTLMIYEAVHIALGRDLWGCRVIEHGPTLFITAEDSRPLFAARLREVMAALNLTAVERRVVLERIKVWDVSDNLVRLAELDDGNIRLTALADSIVERYRDAGLVQVVFDPAISFGPGERLVNDGEQAIVTACRRIIRGLNCCVQLIHHTGKANARNGALDQYAARGGTALPDGCRMVNILQPVSAESSESGLLNPPEGFELLPGDSGLVMSRAKLSYAPPQPNIWVRRRGYTFDYFIEQPRNSEQTRSLDADKVFDFIKHELERGKKYTTNILETCGKLNLSRPRLRTALARLRADNRLEDRELSQVERKGGKKTYLGIRDTSPNLATDNGEVGAENPINASTQEPTSPLPTTSPPYRKYKSGEVAAAFNSPDSLTSPFQNGEVAAKWRSSEDSQPQAETEPFTTSTETVTACSVLPSGARDIEVFD